MQLIRSITLVLLFLCACFFAEAAAVQYTIKFPEPQSHYAEVEMHITGWQGGALEVRMPVWTPGSYLVREFSRNLESLSATDNKGRNLNVTHSAKNAWIVTDAGSDILIRYKVYAFELTVRTSYIDADHAYLNPSSVCLYVNQHLDFPCTVKIEPFRDWKVISTPLDPVKSSDIWTVSATNYDELADSPFEIGNHTVLKITAAGVPHEIAMFGEGNYSAERLKGDFVKIIEEETSIFGVNPCKRYVFFIHNLATGGGGLEHLNSTTVQTGRWNYATESGYNGFLSLVAHEYFHLWNVKRLRPEALGPFDYSNENYTTMLWFAEGVTAYYDDLIVRRCGFTSPDNYLGTLAGSLSYVDNTAGNKIQSLNESSFDAWIKFYKPAENSANNTISYYTKGSVIGAMLNFHLMNVSGGNKTLDGLMKFLYERFYVSNKGARGYSESEFRKAVSDYAGTNVDDFFTHYVSGTDSIPYDQFTKAIGMKVIDLNKNEQSSWLGANASIKDGKLTVTSVERNSPAWKDGINVNDELIAIDQYRISEDVSRLLNMHKPGEKINVLVNRSGFIRTIPVTLQETPYVKYAFQELKDADAVAKDNLKKWLKTK